MHAHHSRDRREGGSEGGREGYLPLTTVAAISKSEQKYVSLISQYFSANFCMAFKVTAGSGPAAGAAPPALCLKGKEGKKKVTKGGRGGGEGRVRSCGC